MKTLLHHLINFGMQAWTSIYHVVGFYFLSHWFVHIGVLCMDIRMSLPRLDLEEIWRRVHNLPILSRTKSLKVINVVFANYIYSLCAVSMNISVNAMMSSFSLLTRHLRLLILFLDNLTLLYIPSKGELATVFFSVKFAV